MPALRRALVAAAAVVLAAPAPAAAADRLLHTEGNVVRDADTGAAVAASGTIGGLGSFEQSPDGSRLARAELGAPRWPGALVLSGADGACPVAIPGIDGAGDVSWAPDSVRLAAITGSVLVIDTGHPAYPRAAVPGTASASSVSWHPSPVEDLLLVTVSRQEAPYDGEVLLARPGGVVRTIIGGPTDDRDATWSRDGARLAFTRREADGTRRVYVAAGDGSGARPVGPEVRHARDLRWTRDGRILASDEPGGPSAGSPGIWSIDPDSGVASRRTTGDHRSPDDAPLGTRHGYAVVTADGTAHGFGASCTAGAGGIRPVAAAGNPAGPGHWQVDAGGRVRALAPAAHHGDLAGRPLNQPIVGMAPTPSGAGYWLVARDGGIFSFGDAVFHGSTGAMRLNQPIVGMAATPSGRGYWLVAGDGGIFSFGDAVFHGSTGAMRLNQPIVGMHRTDGGAGYWLVARDGGIFSFGDARFAGSTGAMRLNQPIIGMGRVAGRAGYWLVAADGGVFSFGDHRFLGSTGGIRIAGPAAGLVVETIRG